MKFRYYALTLVYCLGLFWLSSQTFPPDREKLFPGEDKAVHMVLFGGLAGVVSVGLRRSGRDTRPGAQWLAPVAFTFFYALSDECHQYFVPGRSFDPLDIVADTAGALLAQGVLCRVWWRVPFRQEPSRGVGD